MDRAELERRVLMKRVEDKRRAQQATAEQTAAPDPDPQPRVDDNPLTMTPEAIQAKMKDYLGAGRRLTQGPGIGEYMPAIGPAMEKAGAGIAAVVQAPFTDRTIGQHYDENLQASRQRREDAQRSNPEGEFAKSMLAQTVIPGPKVKGFMANTAANTAVNSGLAYGDAQLRDKDTEEAVDDAQTAGGWTGGLAAASKSLGLVGKGYARFMAGIRPQTLERYRSRAPQINELTEEVAHRP